MAERDDHPGVEELTVSIPRKWKGKIGRKDRCGEFEGNEEKKRKKNRNENLIHSF